MAKNPSVELFRHEGQNPFSGEFSNAVCMRRCGSGKVAVWVRADNVEYSSEDCRYEDIDSPEDFVAACRSCLEFVEFGDASIVDVVRSAYSHLKDSDSVFAAKLRSYLLEEFEEDCAEEAERNQEAALSGGHSVRTLTNEEAREKYGGSVVFVGTSNAASDATDNIVPLPAGNKSVRLRVQWPDDVHELLVGPDDWKRIMSGEKVSINGSKYFYDGKSFGTVWRFNLDEVGQLCVSYFADADPSEEGDGFIGLIGSAVVAE